MGKSRQEALNLALAVADYFVVKEVYDKAVEHKNITPEQIKQFSTSTRRLRTLADNIIHYKEPSETDKG
jgi:hypothetical protein